MSDAGKILQTAGTILLVDWPSRDVPETLARAGYVVFVKGGPEPDNYSVYEVRDAKAVSRPGSGPPAHADLVYSHRPIGELPGIVALARQVGATAVWHQSGQAGGGADDPRGCWMPEAASREARATVESAGLTYVEAPYIADAVRRLGIHR
jgi:predicted CoA-binding protein